MGLKLKLTNLQNVVAGNVATLKLPSGKGAPTYDQIQFALTGGALPSHIESVKIRINGRIAWDEGSGTEINKRDAFRGIAAVDGFVVLDFTEPKARNGAAEQLVASLPGQLCQDITVELKLAAGFVGAIKATAVYRPPTVNPLIKKMLSIPTAFNVQGSESAPNVLYVPTGGAGGKIKRLWIHEDGDGAITSLLVRLGTSELYEISREQLENDQLRNGLVPQAGICVLDLIEDGNLAGLIDTGAAPQVELRMVTDDLFSGRTYMEVIDPIGRL